MSDVADSAKQPAITLVYREIACMLAPGESLDFAVTGQCMAPLLCDGQRISVRKQSWYLPGDVIAFADIYGNPLVHRFLGWVPGKRGLRSMSKPDASRAIDVLFPRQHILGKVTAVDAVPHKVAMTDRVVAVCNYVRCSLEKLMGCSGQPLLNDSWRR